MKCSRCGGMMVSEEFYSQEDNFLGWRCISCGEILDQVILENRLGQKRGYSFSYVPSRLREDWKRSNEWMMGKAL